MSFLLIKMRAFTIVFILLLVTAIFKLPKPQFYIWFFPNKMHMPFLKLIKWSTEYQEKTSSFQESFSSKLHSVSAEIFIQCTDTSCTCIRFLRADPSTAWTTRMKGLKLQIKLSTTNGWVHKSSTLKKIMQVFF